MDEFLAEVAVQRLKPVAWQVLFLCIGRRHLEAYTDVRVLERSDDARWRACRDLARKGWIERVTPGDAYLWRLTDVLRARLDGSTAPKTVPTAPPASLQPVAAPASFSPDAPAVVPSATKSFSPPNPPTEKAQPAFSQAAKPAPVADPSLPPFLHRTRESQIMALQLWHKAGVRIDLLRVVLARLNGAQLTHPELDEALMTAERWALKLAL